MSMTNTHTHIETGAIKGFEVEVESESEAFYENDSLGN